MEIELKKKTPEEMSLTIIELMLENRALRGGIVYAQREIKKIFNYAAINNFNGDVFIAAIARDVLDKLKDINP